MAEEIHLEMCNFRNFRSPLTLTFDRVIRHIAVHHLSTSVNIPNFIEIGQTLWMDGRTDISPIMLLGRLRVVDLIIRMHTMIREIIPGRK